jgi:hypothetical protein
LSPLSKDGAHESSAKNPGYFLWEGEVGLGMTPQPNPAPTICPCGMSTTTVAEIAADATTPASETTTEKVVVDENVGGDVAVSVPVPVLATPAGTVETSAGVETPALEPGAGVGVGVGVGTGTETATGTGTLFVPTTPTGPSPSDEVVETAATDDAPRCRKRLAVEDDTARGPFQSPLRRSVAVAVATATQVDPDPVPVPSDGAMAPPTAPCEEAV